MKSEAGVSRVMKFNLRNILKKNHRIIFLFETTKFIIKFNLRKLKKNCRSEYENVEMICSIFDVMN